MMVFENLRSSLVGADLRHLPQIKTDKGSVLLKRLHGQLGTSSEITLSNLNHGAKVGDTLPRSVQERTRQRVEDNIHTPVVGCVLDITQERGISGIEDVRAGDVVVLNEVLGLFLVADSAVDLSTKHLSDLDGSEADTTASRVDENGLMIS